MLALLRRNILAALLFMAITGAACAQVAPQPSQPGGLSVAPVQLSLSSMSRSVSTLVSNPGNDPITVQVRLYSWSMRGEEEAYAPALDAGFSPPLFRLEAHATQAVRVVAKVPPGDVERSYRLVVDQLPLADAPGQLQLPVRMVLPVFVEPAPDVSRSPVLGWSAHYDVQAKRMTITVRNGGAVHARIVDLAVEGDGRKAVIAAGLAGYALPHQAREWSYKADDGPASLTITAHDGAAALHVTVPVTR